MIDLPKTDTPVPVVTDNPPAYSNPTPLVTQEPISNSNPVDIKKKKVRIITVLVFGGLIFLIVFILIIKSIISGNKNTSGGTSTDKPTPQASGGVVGDSYKLYQDQKLGYFIKYPKELYGKKNNDLFLLFLPEKKPEVSGSLAPSIALGKTYLLEDKNNELSFWVNTRGDLYKNITKAESINIGDYAFYQVTQDNEGVVSKDYLIKRNTSIIIFTLTLPDKLDTENNNKLTKIFDEIISSYKTTTPVDFTKWETWNDPYGFTLQYPPRTNIKSLYGKTQMTVKTESGDITIEFCPNCKKEICIGSCSNEREIKIQIADLKYLEKSIWPDENGNRAARVVLKYPHEFTDKTLSIHIYFPDESLLDYINEILQTFKWKEEED